MFLNYAESVLEKKMKLAVFQRQAIVRSNTYFVSTAAVEREYFPRVIEFHEDVTVPILNFAQETKDPLIEFIANGMLSYEMVRGLTYIDIPKVVRFRNLALPAREKSARIDIRGIESLLGELVVTSEPLVVSKEWLFGFLCGMTVTAALVFLLRK